MAQNDYYDDRRYCFGCGRYVTYLQSPLASYCTECGGAVQLFSGEDLARFQRGTLGSLDRGGAAAEGEAWPERFGSSA